MTENWKPVVGWREHYEVSDQGRVRSKDRKIVVKNPVGRYSPRRFKGRLLRPGALKSGYQMVSFTAPGRKRECFYVHALVLRAFVGPTPPAMECCHNNGRRADNRLCNLRYDTRTANALDRHKHGTMNVLRGVDSSVAKLNPIAVRAIRRAHNKESLRSLGRKYGVAHKTISAVINRETWRHI